MNCWLNQPRRACGGWRACCEGVARWFRSRNRLIFLTHGGRLEVQAMDTFTETICYRDFVTPVRYGLRWLGIALMIVLALAVLLLWRDVADFALICIMGLLPVSLIAFISSWSRARELVRQSETITLSPTTLTVNNQPRSLEECRWFRGYAFHQPKLSTYPVSEPAIVIAWPPYSEESRAICGTGDRRGPVISILSEAGIPEDSPRPVQERGWINAATLGGVLCFAAEGSLINLLSPHDIPGVSFIISAIVSGMAARVLMKHRLGLFQFQESPHEMMFAAATIIVLGTLKMNRRGGGGPLIQNPEFLLWTIPLAGLQFLSLGLLYSRVRRRENARLGIADHTAE